MMKQNEKTNKFVVFIPFIGGRVVGNTTTSFDKTKLKNF